MIGGSIDYSNSYAYTLIGCLQYSDEGNMENPAAMIAEHNEHIEKNNRTINDYKKILGRTLSGMDISSFKGSILESPHNKTAEIEAH